MIFPIAAIIAILILFVGAAAFVARRFEMETSGSWPFDAMIMSQRLPDRPRGVQEEDLPRFVFRDEAPAAAAR